MPTRAHSIHISCPIDRKHAQLPLTSGLGLHSATTYSKGTASSNYKCLHLNGLVACLFKVKRAEENPQFICEVSSGTLRAHMRVSCSPAHRATMTPWAGQRPSNLCTSVGCWAKLALVAELNSIFCPPLQRPKSIMRAIAVATQPSKTQHYCAGATMPSLSSLNNYGDLPDDYSVEGLTKFTYNIVKSVKLPTPLPEDALQ